ncbi:MAG TPA: DUF1453 domain-containing protein [Verrucomicrobiae bacterium]|nr:DUF1453 domain-containing protein [Verrucomicrobiae bacterium]
MAAPTVPILFGGLIAWSIYRRVRRNIGRQKLRPRRIIVSLVIFAIIGFLIVASSWMVHHTNVLLGFGGGILLGAVLGFVGLRLTKFETTDEGHFYIPNVYIGSALSLLLVGRMLYRMWQVHDLSAAQNHPPMMQSALTYFIIGLTFGYYIVYYIGLFVHTHDKKPGA